MSAAPASVGRADLPWARTAEHLRANVTGGFATAYRDTNQHSALHRAAITFSVVWPLRWCANSDAQAIDGKSSCSELRRTYSLEHHQLHRAVRFGLNAPRERGRARHVRARACSRAEPTPTARTSKRNA
jgi:hypothetical protein